MIDFDTYMRSVARHRGKVRVTRDGYADRYGVLLGWSAPQEMSARVQFDGHHSPLRLNLRRYGVEAIK